MTTEVKLNDDTKIPSIGFGLYLVDPKEAENITYKALKAGYRHIDTAELYKNELETVKGIKRWLDESPENKREDLYYTTKIQEKNVNYEDTTNSLKQRIEIAKPYIGYIDLVLIHTPQTSREGRLGAWKAFQELRETDSKIIRSYGVSNYSDKHLKELLEWDGLKFKPVIDQIELNPWLTRADIVKYARDNDIVIEAHTPLTRGTRINDPQVSELAKKYGKTNGQILLNWSLKQGFVPLVKTVNEPRLKENLDATTFQLSNEDTEALTHDEGNHLAVPSWDPVNYSG